MKLVFADSSVSVPYSEFATGTRSLCKERWWCRVHLSRVVPSGILQEFVWWTLRHFRQPLFCFTISHFSSTVEFWYIGHAETKCFALQPSGHFLSWSSPLSLALLSERCSLELLRWSIVNVLLCLANQSNLKPFFSIPISKLSIKNFSCPARFSCLVTLVLTKKSLLVTLFLVFKTVRLRPDCTYPCNS